MPELILFDFSGDLGNSVQRHKIQEETKRFRRESRVSPSSPMKKKVATSAAIKASAKKMNYKGNSRASPSARSKQRRGQRRWIRSSRTMEGIEVFFGQLSCVSREERSNGFENLLNHVGNPKVIRCRRLFFLLEII
ncbi:hypothetical protein U1Q18_017142 [Sarracenia purpurea var. burkii]